MKSAFIRFKGDIYNIDHIVRIWVAHKGLSNEQTLITQQNGSNEKLEIKYDGNHVDEIWDALTQAAEGAHQFKQDLLEAIRNSKQGNIVVDDVLGV